MAIFINTRVRIVGTFRDSNGALIDPTLIQFTLTTPPIYGQAQTQVLTFKKDAALVRDSIGQYHFDLLVNFTGIANFRWASLANGQEAADEGNFSVQASRV